MAFLLPLNHFTKHFELAIRGKALYLCIAYQKSFIHKNRFIMKNYLNQLSLFILSLGFASQSVFAQSNADFLLVQMDEASNPNAISRIGNTRPTTQGGYVSIGTWGDGEWSRAILMIMDGNLTCQRAIRLHVEIPGFLPGQTRAQESYGADVVQTGNNEYVALIAVNMSLAGQVIAQDLDYYLLKLIVPASGNPQTVWSRRLRGVYNDTPQCLERTRDNGFILSGYSNPEQALNAPSVALTVLGKYDANGSLEWARRYMPNTGECRTDLLTLLPGTVRRPVVQTQDNGYVFTQHCNEYIYITKVDAQGNLVWNRRFRASNGFFDGFVNSEWQIIFGFGAGTAGAVIGVRELPDGRLAFLGNQFSFIVSAWGIPAGNNAVGALMPMSYVFITSADGNFLHGNAFFQRTPFSNTNPIDILAHDFQLLSNGNFVVSVGLRSHCFNGPDCTFVPGLLEVNPQATGFDAAVVQSLEVTHPSAHHYATNYPYGLDYIRLTPVRPPTPMVFSYSKHYALLNRWPGQGGSTLFVGCTQNSGSMHSFPFTLDIGASADVTSETLSVAASPATSWVISIVNSVQSCLVSSTLHQPEPTHRAIAHIVPKLTSHSFEIQVLDTQWQQATYILCDLQGRIFSQGRLSSNRQEVSVIHLPAGMYIIRLQNNNNIVTERVIVQRP